MAMGRQPQGQAPRGATQGQGQIGKLSAGQGQWQNRLLVRANGNSSAGQGQGGKLSVGQGQWANRPLVRVRLALRLLDRVMAAEQGRFRAMASTWLRDTRSTASTGFECRQSGTTGHGVQGKWQLAQVGVSVISRDASGSRPVQTKIAIKAIQWQWRSIRQKRTNITGANDQYKRTIGNRKKCSA